MRWEDDYVWLTEKDGNDTVMNYLKVLSQHLSGSCEDNTEYLSQDSQCSKWGLNLVPPKYMTDILKYNRRAPESPLLKIMQ